MDLSSTCDICGKDTEKHTNKDILCSTLNNEDLFWDLQEQKILDFGENS